MLKVLTALMAVLIPATVHAGPVDERGGWQPFKEELVFEAQTVEMDGPLTYWVKPSEGFINQTAKVMEDMRSPFVIANPFVFKIPECCSAKMALRKKPKRPHVMS